jgi:large subunit ribosomal protein L35
MPKLKTNKTAAKRIATITGSGKAMRLRMSAQHLSPGKSKRSLKSTKMLLAVHANDIKRIKRLLPYANIK